MTEPTLHLICHPTWMRDELAKNSSYPVDFSYGFDVPAFGKKDIWWLPQAQAVQLLNSINHHQIPNPPAFTAPPAGLLTQLALRYTQRVTGVLTAEEAVSVLVDWPVQFWKMSTAKNDIFEAKVRTHDELVEAINTSNLPANSVLEYSEPLANDKRIIKEFRFFVSKDKSGDYVIRAYSVYQDLSDPENSVTVYDGATMTEEEDEAVAEFTDEFLADNNNPDFPPAFVVDVALLADGSHAVVEFNPAWCSAWYAADIDGVVQVLERSFQVTAAERKRWSYIPDAFLKQKYASPGYRIWGLA